MGSISINSNNIKYTTSDILQFAKLCEDSRLMGIGEGNDIWVKDKP